MARDERNKVESACCRFSHLLVGRSAPKTIQFLTTRRIFIAYILSICTPFIALGVHFWLTTYANMSGALIALFIFPVLIASALAGLWPGLLATGIGIGLTVYFVLPPLGFFAIAQTADWVRLGILLTLSLMIILLNTILHDAIGRSNAISEELERDISQRNELEKALQKSDERFRIAERLAVMGHFEWNVAEDSILASPSLERIHGVAPGDFKGGYEDWLAMVHPEDRMKIRKRLEEAFKRQLRERSDDFRIVRPGGEVRWMSLRANAEYDSGKKPVHVFGAMTDITERRRSEEKLLESEKRLAVAMRGANVGAWETDLDNGNNIWDKGMPELLGVPSEQAQIESNRWTKYIHPEDRDRVLASFRTASEEGKPWQADFRIRRTDGIIRWHRAQGEVIRACHGHRKMIGTDQDITERKEWEDALRRSEERLRLALDTSNMGTWDWDLQTDEIVWNDQQYVNLGYKPGEVKPSYEAWARRVHPDELASTEEKWRLRVEEGGEYYSEDRIIWNDGTEHWVEVWGRFAKNSAGETIRSYGVTHDITERKRAEEALRKAKDELEMRVQERTEELSKSQQRLQQLASQLLIAQEKERKRVAVELHDGLLSELAAMKMLFEAKMKLLEQGNLSDLSEFKKISDILARVIKESRRMMNNLHPSVLDELGLITAMKWLCGEYQKSYPHIVVEKRIEVLEQDISDSVRVVIFRVLQEALNNFAKHGKGDRVDLSLSKANASFMLMIRDNGQGFDVGNAQKGLGLESMRERVEISGGTFKIESVVGQGTTIQAMWSSS